MTLAAVWLLLMIWQWGEHKRVVNAAPGARYRLWIPGEHTYSAIVTVR